MSDTRFSVISSPLAAEEIIKILLAMSEGVMKQFPQLKDLLIKGKYLTLLCEAIKKDAPDLVQPMLFVMVCETAALLMKDFTETIGGKPKHKPKKEDFDKLGDLIREAASPDSKLGPGESAGADDWKP